jgi:hypothetical protein
LDIAGAAPQATQKQEGKRIRGQRGLAAINQRSTSFGKVNAVWRFTYTD